LFYEIKVDTSTLYIMEIGFVPQQERLIFFLHLCWRNS